MPGANCLADIKLPALPALPVSSYLERFGFCSAANRVFLSRIALMIAHSFAIIALSSAIIALCTFFVCKKIKELYGKGFCFSANNCRKKEIKKVKF